MTTVRSTIDVVPFAMEARRGCPCSAARRLLGCVPEELVDLEAFARQRTVRTRPTE
jgi:hypothetical protein